MEKLSLGTDEIEVPLTEGQKGCGLGATMVLSLFGSMGLIGVFSEAAEDRTSGLVILSVAVVMATLAMTLAGKGYQYHPPEVIEGLQRSLDECLKYIDQNSQVEIKEYIERTKEDNKLQGKKEELTIQQWIALDVKLQRLSPVPSPSFSEELTP